MSYQEQRAQKAAEMKAKGKSFGKIAGGVLLGLTLLGGSFTIIDETEEGVITRLGTQNRTVTAGLNFKIPLIESVDKMPIGVQIEEMDNLTIPTAQNPNQPASANVTVRFNVIPGMSGDIRAKHGTIEKYLHNQIRQDLLSSIRDKGRMVKDTRTLLGGDTLAVMQSELTAEMGELARNEGVNISAILIQNALPHEREATRMEATRARQEQEHTATSEATRKATEDQMVIATAEANRDAAAVDNERLEADATAEANAEVSRAEGRSKAAKLDAEAEAYRNAEVSASITPEMIRMEELRVQAIEAGKGWNGQYPEGWTIYGAGDSSEGINFHKMLK